MFNPGFSAGNLTTLVPVIVEHSVKFRNLMLQRAQTGELFRLDKPFTRLTIDIIGRVVLDHDFNSQFSENPLVTALESQIAWAPIGSLMKPSELIDIRRPYHFWKNTRIMDRYLSRVLDERFETRMSRKKQKFVVDLALETYLKEEKNQSLQQADAIDAEFKKHALSHIKAFLFAGHDTTSSTLQYAYYQLGKDLTVREKMRSEHDRVFGLDPNDAPSKILENPHLLNQLPYTNAFMKVGA